MATTSMAQLIAYERTMAVQSLLAKPAQTLKRLEEIWDKLHYDEQERYRRVQMLSSSLAAVCDHALRSAQGDLDSMELTFRDLLRRLQSVQKSLGLPEDLTGDITAVQRRFDALSHLQHQRRQKIASLEARIKTSGNAHLSHDGQRSVLTVAERDRALLLVEDGKGSVYELLALVHTPTAQFQTQLLVGNVQRVRAIVQQIVAMISDDIAERWTQALSNLTAAVVALVRATHSPHNDPQNIASLNEEAQGLLRDQNSLNLLMEEFVRGASVSNGSGISEPLSIEDLSETRLKTLYDSLGETYVTDAVPRPASPSPSPSTSVMAEIAEVLQDSSLLSSQPSASSSSSDDVSVKRNRKTTKDNLTSSKSSKKMPRERNKDKESSTIPLAVSTEPEIILEAEELPHVISAPVLISTPMATPVKPSESQVITVKRLPSSHPIAVTSTNIATEGESLVSEELQSDVESSRDNNADASLHRREGSSEAQGEGSVDGAPSGLIKLRPSPQPPPKRMSSLPSRPAPKPLPKPEQRSMADKESFPLGSRTDRTILILVVGLEGVGRATLIQRLADRPEVLNAEESRRLVVPLRASLVQQQRPWREICFVTPTCDATQSLATIASNSLREVEGIHALLVVSDARKASSATACLHWSKAAERHSLATVTVATHADEATSVPLSVPALKVSSRTGDGIEELWQHLLSAITASLAPKFAPVIEPQQGTFATETAIDAPSTPLLTEFEDTYGQKFAGKVHWCFIGHHKDKDDALVVAVLKEERDGNYAAVRISKKGQFPFTIPLSSLNSKTPKTQQKSKLTQLITSNLDKLIATHGEDDEGESISQLIEEYLNKESSNGLTYYEMRNPRFAQELKEIERAHPQRRSSFKMAWLYLDGHEKEMPEVFGHKEAPEGFWSLMDGLANKISLKGWKRYRGDFGNDVEIDTYYTEWKGIEIMYHISLWLNSEQHRRLIGNDVVVAVYTESDAPINPVALSGLGTVPQIFAVVKPRTGHPGDHLYRVEFFSRPNIKPYKPFVAIDQCFTLPQLKEFFYTKCYNGYCEALAAPPMNRLYEVPRAAAIKELVAKFPYESLEEAKKRKRGETALRQLIEQNRIRDPLLLLVTVGKSLPPVATSGKEYKNVQVALVVDDMEQRTRIVAKSLHPEWNETLVFNVLAVDPAISTLKVQYRSKDRVVALKEVPFSYICSVLKQEKWIELAVPNVSLSTSASAGIQSSSSLNALASSMAALSLRFDLTGPAAVQCPSCKLYLGSSATVLYEEVQYHESCIACCICATPLKNSEFKVASSKFYCTRCYSRHVDPSDDAITTSLGKANSTFKPGGLVRTTSGRNIVASSVVSSASTTQADDGDEVHLMEQLSRTDSPHTWNTQNFGPLVDCGFCGEAIGAALGKKEGFECSDCWYPCHKHCKDLVPGNCSKDPKNQTFHADSLQGKGGGMRNMARKSLRNIGAKINK